MLTRFSKEMDGSMEPDSDGDWVRIYAVWELLDRIVLDPAKAAEIAREAM